ncbi:MAG TPA: galactose oxidase-like domain-containing protein [Pseudonocardia sp.]
MVTGFLPIPDWIPAAAEGMGVATADLAGDGSVDCVVLAVDAPPGQNRGVYRVGHGLVADGSLPGGWTPWRDVPDWFMFDNQGAAVAVADVTGDGRPDLVVLAIDNPVGVNRGVYRIGRDLDPDGQVTGGWTPWVDVPNWFSWDNQGAGVALADLDGSGRRDIVVFTIDDPVGVNRAIYQVGRNLDPGSGVATGWTGWVDAPAWFSWENQGGSVALVDRDGGHDLLVFAIDNSPERNQAFYRVLPGLRADGTGAGDWGPYVGIANWFSWENRFGGAVVAPIGGTPQLVLGMVDAPVGTTAGYIRVLPYAETPPVHGQWAPGGTSGVLAIHAAVLPTGQVLFFSGSGNNQVRAAAPDFGDVNHQLYTSAVWDPDTHQLTFPDTIDGLDHHPFDFFCGGDTFLPDGTLLSAGGNQAYVAKGRRDAVVFDAAKEEWTHRAPMRAGRWYPTLLPLGDGRVLAVSGLDENANLNQMFEIYSPDKDAWEQLPTPNQNLFFGMPLYAHLFLMRDGRVFFDGGRMDDPNPQGPVVMDLTTRPLTIAGVFGLGDPESRDQSASVLLPPAQDQQVMVIGGGPGDDSNGTGSTAIVDLGNLDAGFRAGEPMSLPRMHLNAVLLPDRTVFVSGGSMAREQRVAARLQSEIYDPSDGTWRSAASASVVRMYHSVALLLPDGRVVAAGGNPPPYGNHVQWGQDGTNEEMRVEIYSPPYLFAGPRPVISAVQDEVAYDQPFAITTPAPDTIRSACLIRPGVTTHAFDNSQRLVDLPIAGRSATILNVTAPATSELAPPGWYMLFIVDESGVPSVAMWQHLHA